MGREVEESNEHNSHTSQDSYTTFLRQSKGFANRPATRASIIMKTGACVGGFTMGYVSQWFGKSDALGQNQSN
jgi:hypothetical protein